MQKYTVVEKAVGETPLQAVERYRAAHPELAGIPLAYAGRLDPMASGQLLILAGDECKRQERYHRLDKSYRFEVLFGVGSDTGDVLGLLSYGDRAPEIDRASAVHIARELSGRTISLLYPKFSSRTVRGKPLHQWTLEGRLHEIEIPVATTRIHRLRCTNHVRRSAHEIFNKVSEKIETISPVTEKSKELGADFRRVDIRASWERFVEDLPDAQFSIATFECTASSGTYMRSLATHIGGRLGVPALAYSIHRTRIGRYVPLPFGAGFWLTRY